MEGSIDEPQRISCQECSIPVDKDAVSRTWMVQFPTPDSPLNDMSKIVKEHTNA